VNPPTNLSGDPYITSCYGRSGRISLLILEGVYGVAGPTLTYSMQIILPDKSVRTLACTSAPIEEILLELGINPTTVIVVKNGKVVPEDVIATEGDEIRILRFSHGG